MSSHWGYVKNIRLIVFISFCFLVLGCASSNKLDSLTNSPEQFILTTDTYQVVISAVGQDSLEFLFITEGEDTFPSFARVSDNALPMDVTDSIDSITVTRGQISARFDKTTEFIEFFNAGQLISTQMPYSASGASFKFRLQDQEKIMGGGQRVLGMDRRGNKLPLYNRAHYGYETESIQMNYSLPAVMSSLRYYLLFDNTASGALDIGATESNLLQFDAVGGRTAYIIGTDSTYPELIDEYTDVTGKPAMLPRWALGHFISRFGYRTQQEVLEVAELTQQKGIPADSIILDLYWFGPDIKGHMGNLDWDNNYFPDPEGMITALDDKGINTILITEPFILTSSERWEEAVAAGAIATNESGEPYRFDFYFGNTGLVDVFSERGRNWFADRYIELFQQNIAGNWGDLGEPEVHPDDIQHYLEETGEWVRGDVLHNAYGHEWAKLVYDTQKSIKPDSRPFILMRSGFAGTQRYGIIPWTGDVSRSWGGLKPQVELSLQMSLFGLGYTHSDIGGFAGTEGYTPEMYLRWSQYGIFQPVYRPHAQEQVASEVVFQDDTIRPIVTDFVKLRYRMTPYNYTIFQEHTQTGMPLMRPMFFMDETSASLIDMNDQYMWGNAFLVKPVTEPGITSTDVWLPEGHWFNFWNDTQYSGMQSVSVPVTLNDIPVLIRAGSFVPMVPDFSDMRSYSSAKLELHYYHHTSIKSAQGTMYEDDGVTANAYESGAFERLSFESQSTADRLSINLNHNGNDYQSIPDNREITLIIHGMDTQPKGVSSDHLNIWQYDYDPKTAVLSVTFNWSYENATITVTK